MYGANYFGQSYFGQAYPALAVGIPTWVSPANHATGINQITSLVFLIPQAAAALHFELQIDSSSSFATAQDFTSWTSQTGWEYYDGASWVAFPSTGVPLGYAGNQARYTLQTGLSVGVWYRRIRGRIRV